MTSTLRRATGLSGIVALALIVVASCVRDGDAQVASNVRIVPDDTAAVGRLLSVVRGVDPVLCELVTEKVDMHGSWSRWGPFSHDPLQMDSAASALLDWIQEEHNDPAVVPRLRAGLRDADPCVRRVSGSFLGRVEHGSAAEALIGALDDPSADTRRVAVLGLGMMGGDERRPSADPLLRRLRDDSPAVRRAAAWALGSIEAPSALMPLIELLGRDPDPLVRQAAAWAIGELNP
jgi:HEAT repeat protein